MFSFDAFQGLWKKGHDVIQVGKCDVTEQLKRNDVTQLLQEGNDFPN